MDKTVHMVVVARKGHRSNVAEHANFATIMVVFMQGLKKPGFLYKNPAQWVKLEKTGFLWKKPDFSPKNLFFIKNAYKSLI